jgi:hypothetical protein
MHRTIIIASPCSLLNGLGGFVRYFYTLRTFIVNYMNKWASEFGKFGNSICHVKHRLRVFENRVLRRIFGPKRDEGTKKVA